MATPIDSVNHRNPAASATRVSVKGVGFADAMQAASQNFVGRRVVIQPGDTLMGLVRTQLGSAVSEQRLSALVNQVSQANGLKDPNRILAGNTLDLSVVNAGSASTTKAAQPKPTSHPVLSKTLDRAVDKGYIQPQERQVVEQRILGMGKQYGFAPDDFARMALMESDGLNPKASNGRCHGIIQFCEGHARGADSVGLRGRAHEIGKMSVPQQLNLVERYFDDVGLKSVPNSSANPRAPQRLGLDDLYLSVLTPSVRQEVRPHVPLNIAGDQARVLYTGADRDKGITRQSLTRGLHQHAQRILNQHEPERQSGNTAATQRQQFAARNSYVEVALLEASAARVGPLRP
jgi:hypothetical protein